MTKLPPWIWNVLLGIGLLTGGLGLPRVHAREKPSDWPGFRGPGGQGISPDKGIPLTWSDTENLVWKVEMPGPGTSSPILFGSRLFLTYFTGYNVPGRPGGEMSDLALHLMCLERATGKTLWTKKIAPKLPEQERMRENHGYASSTPVADADRVYCFFGRSGVYAFDHDGKELWQADVGSGRNGFGSGTSPILVGDLVIVNASIESESLVALDRKTGKERWRTRGIKESWNTPILVPVKGGKTELVLAHLGKILGIDPYTGEELWSSATDIVGYVVPSLVSRDGIVYAIGGRTSGGLAVRAGGRGDVTSTHRLWTMRKGSNVTSPILHDGYLYWMHENLGIAYCAEASSGKIVYEERIETRYQQVYGSAVLADDRIHYLSRTGKTYVVAAKPRYERLAINSLSERSTFNASPAVAGGRLYLRSDRSLYCLGAK